MSRKFINLRDIDAYVISFNLSNYLWGQVIHWDWFAKKTVGEQFVRSMDSVSANLAEGFGRYTKKDKIKFYNYSYGSLKESFDWNEKARVRKLITEEQYNYIIADLQKLPREIHSLIKFTNERLSK